MPMELQGFDNLRDDLTNMASNLEFGAGREPGTAGRRRSPSRNRCCTTPASDPKIITGALHGSIRTSCTCASRRSGGKYITIGVQRIPKRARTMPTRSSTATAAPRPAPAHPFVRPAFDVRKDEAYQIIEEHAEGRNY